MMVLAENVPCLEACTTFLQQREKSLESEGLAKVVQCLTVTTNEISDFPIEVITWTRSETGEDASLDAESKTQLFQHLRAQSWVESPLLELSRCCACASRAEPKPPSPTSREEGAAGPLLAHGVQINALWRADKMPGGCGQWSRGRVATLLVQLCCWPQEQESCPRKLSLHGCSWLRKMLRDSQSWVTPTHSTDPLV